jgi:cation-transporting P-type ATPase 13A2
MFCVGPPYRKPLYTNFWLVIVLTVLCTFSLYSLFLQKGFIFRVLQLVDIPREFRLEILLLVILNIILSWAWETHLTLIVASRVGKALKWWRRRSAGRKMNAKLYKALERDIHV